MTVWAVDPGFAAPVLERLDLDRAVDLVRQVCRVPSVLGQEGPLAAFLAGVMRDSGFESVALEPVLPGRPNAIGEISMARAPGWCSPGTWTPSPSRTAGSGRRRSPAT